MRVKYAIVEKADCAMCLPEVRTSHLVTFYAIGRRGIPLKVCRDHADQIGVALTAVDDRWRTKKGALL